MDERIRRLLEDHRDADRAMTAPAKEVAEHLYQSLLALPEFTLKDGTKARMKPYLAPEPNKDGEMQCGVDVVLDNGSHLEFTMRNSGWGKPFSQELKAGYREPDQRSR